MPESVYDRPTTAHEKIWLLTKNEDYFYNHEAIREPVTGGAHARAAGPNSRTLVDRVPVSRKKIKVPGGWDTEPGAHGTINRSGRTSAQYRELPGVTPKSAPERSNIRAKGSFHASTTQLVETRNARNVWTIAPKAFREAHFATFPPALAERCIKAGTPLTVCGYCGAADGCGGICQTFPRVPGRVLDPFGGAGTVGLVDEQIGVDCTLIELNPEYAEIARKRIGLEQEAA
jgi:DNA modification methylase